MSKLKVFVVEDEPIIADYLEQCLLDQGFEVVGLANSFDHARTLLVNAKPDLLLLDINLGDGPDGVDLAHFVNQQVNRPFLFVTSNTDNQTLERVKLTNPAGFIMKPFRKDDLTMQIGLAWHAFQVRNDNKQVAFTNSVLENTHFFIKDRHIEFILYHIFLIDSGFWNGINIFGFEFMKKTGH